MDEVSVKTGIKLLSDYCDREGPPFSTFLEGVPYSEEYLRNDKARISWDGYCKLMQNVGRTWNDEQLEQMGRKFVHAKAMRKFTTAFQMFISPKDFYKWLYSSRSPGRQDFTCVYSTVSEIGKNKLLGILQMEEGYKPCREFYIITKGAITELSTVIGFPSSKVEMSLVEDAAYYYITVSEGAKALALLRYIIRWPFNLFLAKRELRETLESLQEAYVEIVHAKNQLERRVEERTAELKEAQKIRDHIFTNISHEFRTPLTLIKGPVESMLVTEVSEEQKNQYRLILNNTDKLLMLVNQLLDLSKIESGMMKLYLKNINLSEVISAAAAAFESLAKLNNIAFSIHLPANPVIGMFDPDCIDKIVTNLLANAFKFTGEKGKVSVTLSSIGSFAEIIFKDTGPGIPAEHINKIFERFYQFKQNTSDIHGGTGIGLAHTKDLVELHKGKIEVLSQEKEGTVFTITLPLTHAINNAEQKTEININDSVNSSTTPELISVNPLKLNEVYSKPLILIIDDNEDMRKYLKIILKDEFISQEAVNGKNGIEKAFELIPDLIICDVMMPVINGYEVCTKLKSDERTSHIPVILLTAKASIDSKLEGLETGADSYLTKPFNQKELLIRTKNLIQQRKILREKFSSIGINDSDTQLFSSIDRKFLNKVNEAIFRNLDNENFSVEQLAAEIALSRSQLHRKLIGLINHSPGEYILSVRLQKAAELIRLGAVSVSEIAYSTGFNTPNYFTKCFRKKYGCTPTEYRNKAQII